MVITGPAQKDINNLPAIMKGRVIVELARISAGTAKIEKMREPPPQMESESRGLQDHTVD